MYSCDFSKNSTKEQFGKIQYNVDICPSSEDPWEKERTLEFNQREFIDSIFKKLYNKELEAYDFFTNEKVSIDYLQNLENEGEFSRDNISRIQFDESWSWQQGKLIRKIHSITLAYKVFNHFGEVRGHKPLLKINCR